MLGLLLGVAAVRLCSAGSRVEEWLARDDDKKACDYDFMVMQGFVKNSGGKRSSVFSPVCSEMNILLQGRSGEYGFGAEERAAGDLNRIAETVKKMNDENLRILNETYMLQSHMGRSPGCFRACVQNDAEECARLHRSHAEWVERESRGRVQGLLSIDDFRTSARIYASLACFRGELHHPFSPMKTRFDDLSPRKNGALRRRFASADGRFLRYQHLDCDPERMFDLVAVPYADGGARADRNQSDFTRYAIYLVPKEASRDLDGVWKEFERVSGRDIGKFLVEKCTQDREIKGLESKLDLKGLLKDICGDVPAESRMLAWFSIHEQDEAVVAETFSRKGMIFEALRISVSRPYVLVVYDREVGRILFGVRDVEGLSVSGRLRGGDGCGDCGGGNCIFVDCGNAASCCCGSAGDGCCDCGDCGCGGCDGCDCGGCNCDGCGSFCECCLYALMLCAAC